MVCRVAVWEREGFNCHAPQERMAIASQGVCSGRDLAAAGKSKQRGALRMSLRMSLTCPIN